MNSFKPFRALARQAAWMDSHGQYHIADALDRHIIGFAAMAAALPPIEPVPTAAEEPIEDEEWMNNNEPPLEEQDKQNVVRPLRILTRPPKNPLRKIKNVT